MVLRTLLAHLLANILVEIFSIEDESSGLILDQFDKLVVCDRGFILLGSSLQHSIHHT